MLKRVINFFKKEKDNTPPDMKYLVVGLGNIGDEYDQTRHNVGFEVLDTIAKRNEVRFEDERYGAVARFKFKARSFIMLKPNTYVNLSGRAINYWMQKEKIPLPNLLVVVDDLALPFGTLRLKTKGGDAGHNGLKSIQSTLGTASYSRLRFGIGNEYQRGRQVDFVLGKWTDEEWTELMERTKVAEDIVKAFATVGAGQTMSQYNNK